jgi:hypothetical protein
MIALKLIAFLFVVPFVVIASIFVVGIVMSPLVLSIMLILYKGNVKEILKMEFGVGSGIDGSSAPVSSSIHEDSPTRRPTLRRARSR